jgi:PAS domain S-box-containing protein
MRTLSNAPVMLWVTGPDATRLEFNDAWRQFVGGSTPGEDADGWTDAIHPDDVERCRATSTDAVIRRAPFRIEYRLRRHDGEYRWLLETGAPQFFPDGNLSGYIGSAIDVTDLKLARVALSSLNRRLIQTQDHERASVARELQDALCQRLVGLTLRLHSLSNDGGDESIRGTAADLSREFGDLASEIFGIASQLSSSTVELLGIIEAARAFCRDMSAEHDVLVEFEADDAPSGVPGDIAVPLFGVLQEAVRNAVAHSGATRVKVRLAGGDREIRLDVEDEGVGFDPGTVMQDGLGLMTMKERLSVVDGECAIESRPGAGTRVRASIPLPGKTR